MKKKIVVEYDMINDRIEVYHEDDFTYFEIFALLEAAKILFADRWVEKE